MEEFRKVYVEVNADHFPDGRVRPNLIVFEDSLKYPVDSVVSSCRCVSLKAGGVGIRYTIRVCSHQTYLFYGDDGRWFVEAKNS